MRSSDIAYNGTSEQFREICEIIPNWDEYSPWRIIPDPLDNFAYSISFKGLNCVTHSRQVQCKGKGGSMRSCRYKPRVMSISYDGISPVYASMRRSGSPYVNKCKRDVFPELFIRTDFSEERKSFQYPGKRYQEVNMIPIVDEVDLRELSEIFPDYKDIEKYGFWAYVPDTHHKYACSSKGKGIIFSHIRADGTIMNSIEWSLSSSQDRKDKTKYDECCIQVDGVQKNEMSHRVVLRTFVLNPESKPQVNHIHGVNCGYNDLDIDNLEWCTIQENSDHYNFSSEMVQVRSKGYAKIATWGQNNQKIIQNTSSAKANKSLGSKGSTHPIITKLRSTKGWNSLSDDEKFEILKANKCPEPLGCYSGSGRWMNNGEKQRRVADTQVEYWLSKGWMLGRLHEN